MKAEYFESVWDAIEPNKIVAASLKARADDVMIALQETVKAWGVTQAAAAKRLEITQPRLNDLLRGQIVKLQLDALLNLAPLAGNTVKLRSGGQLHKLRIGAVAIAPVLDPISNSAINRSSANGTSS